MDVGTMLNIMIFCVAFNIQNAEMIMPVDIRSIQYIVFGVCITYVWVA